MSRPVGDDLDGRVSRFALDLDNVRAEASEWTAKLEKVKRSMLQYVERTQGETSKFLLKSLEGETTPEDIAEVMTMAGGAGMAQEIITRCRNAENAIAAHLTQREQDLDHGALPMNLKGRIRELRAEVERFKLIAEENERVLQHESSLSPRETERLRIEIGQYKQRVRQLQQLESQLVDKGKYVPFSEADHLRHLALTHLGAGGSNGPR